MEKYVYQVDLIWLFLSDGALHMFGSFYAS